LNIQNKRHNFNTTLANQNPTLKPIDAQSNQQKITTHEKNSKKKNSKKQKFQ
jgi:hypothetical protein